MHAALGHLDHRVESDGGIFRFARTHESSGSRTLDYFDCHTPCRNRGRASHVSASAKTSIHIWSGGDITSPQARWMCNSEYERERRESLATALLAQRCHQPWFSEEVPDNAHKVLRSERDVFILGWRYSELHTIVISMTSWRSRALRETPWVSQLPRSRMQ